MFHQIHINKSFSKFLNKYNRIILEAFNVIRSFKGDIPNTYQYSHKYPPKKITYKYTDKLYIACMLYISINNSSWTSFIGPIEGKQVHKRFMEYSKNKIFKRLFDLAKLNYLLSEPDTNTILADTTNIVNKQSIEINHRNHYNKNKKTIKISAITDNKGSPLHISVMDGNVHDMKCFDKDIDEFTKKKEIIDKLRRAGKRVILIADKGYDSQRIRNKLKKNNMKPLIKPNNRNTKDKTKIRTFNRHQEKMYKNRIKIEHFFGIIKRYPKVNSVYEKTMNSYLNIVLLVSAMILINRT
jgi:transposase